MNYEIPLSYTPIDEQSLTAVLKRYSAKPHAQLISDFENAIAIATGSRYVVALNSGTAAIHMALKALKVGPGDEVLAPSFTYVASVNPILYQGAIPVLIDSEPQTWNMDPEVLETAIKARVKKPKAIIVVHGYGVPAKMDEIVSISTKYAIPVIEDAAEALGSTYNGIHLGTLTEVGVLSFNNNKIVTTYGGGALLTNDEKLYKEVLHWSAQSREQKTYYEHLEIGYNYRMSSLNAAYGLAQMTELKTLIDNRVRVHDSYKRELSVNGDIIFPGNDLKACTNHWLTTILIKSLKANNTSIEQIQQALFERKIESRPLWKPMHLQPLYKNADFYGANISERLFAEGLCLPSGKDLTQNEIKIVSGIILDILVSNQEM